MSEPGAVRYERSGSAAVVTIDRQHRRNAVDGPTAQSLHEDWPLIEKVVAAGLPVVASTGGLTQEQVDDLVSFFEHRGCDFALMHCVSIYPTPDEACNLANVVPAAMIFVPCKNGVSHNELEDATQADCAAGANALLHTVLSLAGVAS